VLDDIQKELVSAIGKAQEVLRRDLGKLRAGRASPNLLDGIRRSFDSFNCSRHEAGVPVQHWHFESNLQFPGRPIAQK
jgi:hypothetical protein